MAPFLGPSEDQAFKTRRQKPRQEELAGPRRQGPGKRSLPGRPSQSTKAPAGGALREGQTQAPQEKPAAARHAPRQGLMSGKLSGAERQPPRQVTCRGKSPPQNCAPAHPPTRRSGISPKGTWRGTARPEVCGGMQRPSWQTVAHLTVRLGAVRATETGI